MSEKNPLTILEVAPDNDALIAIMKLSDELSGSVRHDVIRDAQIAMHGVASNTSFVLRDIKDGKRLRPRKINNLSIVENTVEVGREVVRSINVADKPDLRIRTFLPIIDRSRKYGFELDESNPSYSADVIKYHEDGWKSCAKDTRYVFEFNADSFAYKHNPDTDNKGWAKLDREFAGGALSMPERLQILMGKLTVPTYVEYQTWLDGQSINTEITL